MFKNLEVKLFCILLSLFPTFFLTAQEHTFQFRNALTVTNDNDFYLLKGSDRYYTNGIYINYQHYKPGSGIGKNEPTRKIILTYELGQQIFNAYKRKIEPENTQDIDRPIAGYLFLSFSNYYFYAGNNMWYWKIAPGIVGPASLGKQVQSGWHNVIGIQTKWDWIWKYQIRNSAGLDLSTGYNTTLINKNKIQISSISNITVGTLHDYVSQMFNVQFGKIRPLFNSRFWKSDFGGAEINGGNNPEFFVYYQPSLTYRLFDATVQGGLFNSDKGPITSNPITFLLENTFGLFGRFGRFSTTLKLVAQSREATSQINSHVFGSLSFGYLFK